MFFSNKRIFCTLTVLISCFLKDTCIHMYYIYGRVSLSKLFYFVYVFILFFTYKLKHICQHLKVQIGTFPKIYWLPLGRRKIAGTFEVAAMRIYLGMYIHAYLYLTICNYSQLSLSKFCVALTFPVRCILFYLITNTYVCIYVYI